MRVEFFATNDEMSQLRAILDEHPELARAVLAVQTTEPTDPALAALIHGIDLYLTQNSLTVPQDALGDAFEGRAFN